jgi:general secretion pathway protein K
MNRAASRRQRGVALITAVLMVALATMLAVDVGYRGFLDQRRSGTLFALDQGLEIALGAEAWAADFLKRDMQESQNDHLGETWARPLPPLPIEGGTVEGRLEDMQGRFNLNNLVHGDGTPNPVAVQQLERILALLEIEPSWAAAMASRLKVSTKDWSWPREASITLMATNRWCFRSSARYTVAIPPSPSTRSTR